MKKAYYQWAMALVCSLSGISSGQAQVLQWQARYGQPSWAGGQVSQLQVDAAGNSYLAGTNSVNSVATGFVAKYSPGGQLLWSHTQAGKAGVAVYAGTVLTAEEAATGIRVSAVGDDGRPAWTATYGQAGDILEPVAVALNATGGYVLVRKLRIAPNGWGILTFVLLRYVNGVQQWATEYPRAADPQKLAVTDAGLVHVLGNGYSDSFPYWGDGSRPTQAMLAQYSPTGQLAWEQRFNAPGNCTSVRSLQLDASGNCYFTSTDRRLDWPDRTPHYALVKYSPQGTLMWADTTQNGQAGDRANAAVLTLDPQGRPVVASLRRVPNPFNGGGGQITTTAYDTGGQVRWRRAYGTATANDTVAAIVADAAGGVVVLGGSNRTPTGAAATVDWLLLRYDAAGQPQGPQWYDGPAGQVDLGHAVALAPNGDLVAAGEVDGAALTNPVYFFTYLQGTVGVARYAMPVTKAGAPRELAQLGLYPNPCTEQASLQLPAGSRLVEVQASTGQLVLRRPVSPTEGTVVLPMTAAAPGLYVVKVHTATGVYTQRLVKH